MDKCVRIAVALAVSSHIVSGRSYFPDVRQYEDFHQGYDYPSPHHHHSPGQWHHDHAWEQSRPSASYDNPSYHQRDHKGHKYPHDDKDWKQHHSGEWDSGSWEYPDFPNHGNPNSWGQHQWGGHGRPNQWPKPQSGSPWSNNPTWDQERPSTTAPVNPPPTSPKSTTGGSQDTLTITLCIRSCPVTAEYNPVCGSNNVTYSNPGRLECAKFCGVDVTLGRNSACPPPRPNNGAVQNQTTTARPGQTTRPTLRPIPPTRFTTIEIPATFSTDRPAPVKTNPPFTISPDILDSIFTPSTTTEDDFEIDIRTRNRFPNAYPV